MVLLVSRGENNCQANQIHLHEQPQCTETSTRMTIHRTSPRFYATFHRDRLVARQMTILWDFCNLDSSVHNEGTELPDHKTYALLKHCEMMGGLCYTWTWTWRNYLSFTFGREYEGQYARSLRGNMSDVDLDDRRCSLTYKDIHCNFLVFRNITINNRSKPTQSYSTPTVIHYLVTHSFIPAHHHTHLFKHPTDTTPSLIKMQFSIVALSLAFIAIASAAPNIIKRAECPSFASGSRFPYGVTFGEYDLCCGYNWPDAYVRTNLSFPWSLR